MNPEDDPQGVLGRLFGSWNRLRENPVADIALGFTPAGVAADVQDASRAIGEGDLVGLGLAGVGMVPGVGDALKTVGKALRRRRTVASMFSGGGTLEGAMEGIENVLASEVDPDALEQLSRVVGRQMEPMDVLELDPEVIAKADPDLLHASPVCTRFSCANKSAGEIADDVRAAQAVARTIIEARPRAVSIENVPAYLKSESYQGVIRPALERAGYNFDEGVYNAADFGGIQDRSRMITRAVREGDLPEIPATTPRGDWYSALEDLIEEAPETSAVPRWEMDRIRAMADRGTISLDEPIITMGGSAGRSTAYARNPGVPAPTLKAGREKPRILLPEGSTREVTPAMMRRIMGLPEEYPLPENFYRAKSVLGKGMEGNLTRALIEPLTRR